jgi:hypothetical protein
MVSSKHGLERKFKPWRKGKSSSKSKARIVNDNEEGDAASSGLSLRRRDDGPNNMQKKNNNNSRHTNASLKNLLRSQRRLLDRLIKSNNEVVVSDNNDDTANTGMKEESAIDITRSKIKLLEEEITAHEVREREKKNASKYHQVKFIERQKLTRLQKSIKRQLQQAIQAQSTNATNDKRQQRQQKQISNLEKQLQSIAMDQLYIAFYPTDLKYMALFTNGMNRVVDDERGRARRQKVWNTIREGLLEEIKTTTTITTDKNNEDDAGNDSGNDSSSVPSSDSDDSDVEDVKPVKQQKKQKKKPLLIQTKKWINLDDAKRVLLSMLVDTYPNSTSYSTTDTAPAVTTMTKNIMSNAVTDGKEDATTSSNKQQSTVVTTAATAVTKTISDSRFALSNDLNKLFPESTTGDDYHALGSKKEEMDSIDNSNDNRSDRSDSSSDEDDADPLLDFNNAKSSVRNVAPPSSSSSSSSDDSSDDSDSSDNSLDSDSNAVPSSSSFPSKKNMTSNNADVINKRHTDKCKEVDEKVDDDFFATATTTTTSTEDIFSQVQNQGSRSGKTYENNVNTNKGGGGGKGDKSRGFKTQKQSKKGYASFQNRNKRQKFI